MKVVLLGYMASGKSAVGRILAEENNFQFIDLDDFIEEKEQLSITEIFKTKGEVYFRIKEGEYLHEMLNLDGNYIFSLGGGTPCFGNNMEIVQKNAISFYLKASISTIFNRLKNETNQRPLVSAIGENDLQEFIAKHLFERAIFYDKASHTVIVNNKDLNTIATEIQTLF